MGADIHAIIQVKQNDQWVFKSELNLDRCYNVFSVLANVRNNYGFGGCDLGDPLPVISNPRGLPEDLEFSEINEEYLKIRNNAENPDDNYFWLGDHSHSYLFANEILDFNWDYQGTFRGVICNEEIDSYIEGSIPENYCGDAMSRDPNFRKKTIEWKESIKEKNKYCVDPLLDSLNRLIDEGHEAHDIRLVFGFDS